MGNQPLKLSKYSIGTGDRFAHQAKAQLQACLHALEHGVEIVPVWNKSNREHMIIGSELWLTELRVTDCRICVAQPVPFNSDIPFFIG